MPVAIHLNVTRGDASGRGSSQNSRGGRGGRGGGRNSRGRGRGGQSKPKTQEELDDEMKDYFMKDKKSGGTHLDNDLDDYFANRTEKKDEAAGDGDGVADADAPEDETAAAETS